MNFMNDPVTLLVDLVDARATESITARSYSLALQALSQHFWTHLQRLEVMNAPHDYDEATTLLAAAKEGLSTVQNAVEKLRSIDPVEDIELADEALEDAETGMDMIVDVHVANQEEMEKWEGIVARQ